MNDRKPVSQARRRRQRGNNTLEFALLSLVIVPLMMGTVTVGIGLGKSIQTSQVARDSGHMFVRQVDFSQTANQDLLVRLAQGMNMTRTGGNGVIILSQVLMIGPNECASAGLDGTQCANMNHAVVTQRIVIGNPSLYTSTIGTPNYNLLAANGTIAVADYLVDVTCRANTLSTGGENPAVGLLTLQNAERTYIAESYFTAPELSFINHGVPARMYARNYF